MTINYAEQYQGAVAQRYTADLRFSNLINNNETGRYRWTGANTIQIPSIDLAGSVDTDRGSVGGYTRQPSNEWQTVVLQFDRVNKHFVDPMDVDETNQAISVANMATVAREEHDIPEQDSYISSNIYQKYEAAGGAVDNTALDPQVFLDWFDEQMKEMSEAEVPRQGRILYVTPVVAEYLNKADGISRTMSVQNDGDINRTIKTLDGVEIREVPSVRMKTAFDFTNGVTPTGQQINAILLHPAAVITPMKYSLVKIDEPSAVTDGKYFFYSRYYMDCFVLNRRVGGIRINAEAGGVEG